MKRGFETSFLDTPKFPVNSKSGCLILTPKGYKKEPCQLPREMHQQCNTYLCHLNDGSQHVIVTLRQPVQKLNPDP